MKKDRKAAVKKMRTLVLTPKMQVETFRSAVEQTFGTVFLPNNVECTEKIYGTIPCDVLSPEIYSSNRIILYVHGGSFVGGSRASWRNFCASLANATSCRVIVPEFRLAPTHPFPGSIDDLVEVFRAIYAQEEIMIPPANEEAHQEEKSAGQSHIIIAADGSGASLALALLFKINKKYRPAIHTLLLFSPWLDVSSENPLIKGRHVSDEVLSGEALHRAVDMYTYAANIANPLVSPLKANPEDFENFPPVYIQMGKKEILLQQAQEFDMLLDRAGIDCTLDIWDDMMYMFQMADEFLPESHLAIEKIGAYIKKREEDENEKRERNIILKKNNIAIQD